MSELGLICKQPGPHAYKQATVERPDIPNVLNREFEPEHANQVWCGDITYIWTGNRWHYLAAVLDLYTRRVVVGLCRPGQMQTWRLKHWIWRMSRVVSHRMCYSTVIRVANTAHANIDNDYGAIA